MTDEPETPAPPDAPAPISENSTPAPGSPPDADEPPDAWDRTAGWLGAHGALPALAAITIGMIAIYFRMFRGELAGDDLTFHMAESARIADCLRVGDFDLWNPSANGGFASAYYYQVVPQLVSAIPAAIFGHHLFFFQLSVFLPLVLAPAAAYRGMRVMGATPWQAVVAALAVGFLNGESRWGTGNAGTFNVGLYTQTWALAAFPLALGHTVRWATHGKGLAPSLAWGAFVTLCHPFAGVSLVVAVVAGWIVRPVLVAVDRLRHPPRRWFGAWIGELKRLAVLGIGLFITWMPIWLPLGIDYEGFGGFPHRVNDEVGPGFQTLLSWYAHGSILDFNRPFVLTWTLPVVALFARPKFMRWLWAPALVFAIWLGMGPHLGKTDDDLVPAVRFLGAMQIVMALAVGSGFIWLGQKVWNMREDARLHRLQHPLRTTLAALAAALVILIVLPGARALSSRVHVLSDYEGSHGNELHEITQKLQQQPPGRKQVGEGATNHWWNLLSYEYGRRPSLLMMGGGGLQASPNYDFLWTVKDFAKNAWVYDAPILVFGKSNASAMPLGETVFTTKNYEVRRLPSPGLVSAVEVIGTLPPGRKPAHAAALEWFKTDQPMKDRVEAYDGFGGQRPGSEDHKARGTPGAKVLRAFRQDSPGDDADIYAEVEATELTTFMARESWHPRWHVYVDQVEATVRRVTPDFLAVDVAAGHHTIAFRFERPWWAQAAWLAWPVLPLLAWGMTRRRRRITLPVARVIER